MGPVWDLDNALDNFRAEPLNVSVTSFEQHPLFNRLILDLDFLKKLEERYAELRRGPLDTEKIYKVIDETVFHLGPAIDREWYRWAEVYRTDHRTSLNPWIDENGDELIRNALEHRQEIYRIKTSILLHGERIPAFLRAIELNTIYDTGILGSMAIALLAVMIIFIIPCIYIARR